MNKFLQKIFSDTIFDTEIYLTAFSISHFIYLALIIGFIVGSYILLKNKNDEAKISFLRGLTVALVILYLGDFFFHDFVYGQMSTDKLPFHMCTVLCPIIAFAQFNKKFKCLITPAAFLAIAGSLMYLCYPNIGEAAPWSYRAVQTVAYHTSLLAWGIFSIIYEKASLDIKKCWHTAIMLGGITVWAKLGNVAYYFSEEESYNWFFLEEDAFYIGLVGNGILPKWSLMIINPVVFFLAVLAIYGVCILIKSKTSKNKPTTPPTYDKEEEEKILENA